MKTLEEFITESSLTDLGGKLAFKYLAPEFGGARPFKKWLAKASSRSGSGIEIENVMETIWMNPGEGDAIIAWLNAKHGFKL